MHGVMTLIEGSSTSARQCRRRATAQPGKICVLVGAQLHEPACIRC
jgi:hypothetical protein